jgi:predicted transcriptional regulator
VSHARGKFSTKVDSETLEAVRALAAREGRQIQTLVEEALTDLLEKHRIDSPRAQVMSSYVASHEKYAELYKKLAK